MSECAIEWTNEWMNEQVLQSVNEFVSEAKSCFFYKNACRKDWFFELTVVIVVHHQKMRLSASIFSQVFQNKIRTQLSLVITYK